MSGSCPVRARRGRMIGRHRLEKHEGVDCRDADQDVDEVREPRVDTEDGRDEVEVEEADEAPVEPAYDDEDKRGCVESFHVRFSFPLSAGQTLRAALCSGGDRGAVWRRTCSRVRELHPEKLLPLSRASSAA